MLFKPKRFPDNELPGPLPDGWEAFDYATVMDGRVVRFKLDDVERVSVSRNGLVVHSVGMISLGAYLDDFLAVIAIARTLATRFAQADRPGAWEEGDRAQALRGTRVWTALCPRCQSRSWLDHKPVRTDAMWCEPCEGSETPEGGRWTRTRIRAAED